MIVVDPPAADINMMGMEIIEVGGQDYINMGSGWLGGDADTSETSMADSMSPKNMFGSFLEDDAAEGYSAVGEEQKNGVDTIHYTASADALGEYGDTLGVTGGTWSADVWIAKDGGYPVSMKVAETGGSESFLLAMDITNINDPGNVITAPAVTTP